MALLFSRGDPSLIKANNNDNVQPEHVGITCDRCGQNPIKGNRWKCIHCVDYDLCNSCEAVDLHDQNHLFVKIRNPISTKIPTPLLDTQNNQHFLLNSINEKLCFSCRGSRCQCCSGTLEFLQNNACINCSLIRNICVKCLGSIQQDLNQMELRYD